MAKSVPADQARTLTRQLQRVKREALRAGRSIPTGADTRKVDAELARKVSLDLRRVGG